MSFVLLLSIALRIIAMIWSIALVRRLHDWRMAFLTGMLALMALRQSLTLSASMTSWSIELPSGGTEIPGLVVSGLAFLAVIFLGRMIDDERRAVAALRSSQEQLQQKKKMEAIGRLSAGVAHDFNNLLMVIIGHSESIAERVGTDDASRRNAGVIVQAGEKAAALTRQLLAFGRGQQLHPERIDLNSTLTELTGMLRELAGDAVEVHTAFDPEIDDIEFDPTELERVLMNLVVNARDAMPDGGRLSISTAKASLNETDAAMIDGITAGPFVQLTVADEGVGMDEATRERIFDPFFTTKDTDHGTGLGLSTTLGIVSQSGGGITVESAPHEGARFDVYLPPA